MSSFGRKAETSFVLHSPETRGVWDLRTLTDGTQLTGLRGGDGIPIPTELRHEPLLIIEGDGDHSLMRVRTELYHKVISVESPGQGALSNRELESLTRGFQTSPQKSLRRRIRIVYLLTHPHG